MFSTLFLAAVASTVSAAPVVERGAPKGWAHGYLENYDTYHERYLDLKCYNQHNTTFFNDCCRPLLSTETVADNRKAYCNPEGTAYSSFISQYQATATASATSLTDASATASADVEVASEYSAVATSTAASSAAAETSAAASAAAVWAEASSSAAAEATTAEATSTWVAPTTTSTAAAETSTAASSSGSSDTKTGGYATFFYQNGVAGACGTVHSDSDYIIAIDTNGYWSNTGVVSEYCGKSITLTNTNNGKSVTAVVADACPTCVSDNSLDLSYAAFTAIAAESDGQVPITWHWA